MRQKTQWFCGIALLAVVAVPAMAQETETRDLSGVWAPYRGREFAPPRPTERKLKPEYQKQYDELRAKISAASERGEQYAVKGLCEPYGMPSMMQVAVYPTEIVQTPDKVVIIGEAFSEVRHIYLGKEQWPLEDVAPGYYGRSVGHWEGDTLVVDTVGIEDDILGYQNVPHSSQMHITERIRRMSPEILHDQITIDDPVVMEEPYTYTLAYSLLPEDYEMVEFVCENNREYIDENNIVRMILKDGK